MGGCPRLMLLMILSDFLSRQGNFTGGAHLMMLFIIMPDESTKQFD
jgi:hypothetical protein